jgi:hypothetical protein
MVRRQYWENQIESSWTKKNIIWLSGVRRAGKTFLCNNLPDIEYFDCELLSTRKILEDYELFLSTKNGKRLVFDEIHRLSNPAEILKVIADHYQNVKVIATGSSTLSASTKFKDTLTGRKSELWLTPMLFAETKDFGNTELEHRLLNGGLPPFFLAADFPSKDFQEWMDAIWAKDIQELFRLERRYSFQKFLELLLNQSGSIFEATRFAKLCEVSRGTITNYLAVLEAMFIVHVIKPFNSHKDTEIVSAPKVYGFDTGFVCHARGIARELHSEDLGLLWEHLVLNELQGRLQTRLINYWRDKRGHEIDFVLTKKHKNVDVQIAIECKWNGENFNSTNLEAFRRSYPEGKNFVVSPNTRQPFTRKYGNAVVSFVDLEMLINEILQSTFTI